jgi:hypothetical protein
MKDLLIDISHLLVRSSHRIFDSYKDEKYTVSKKIHSVEFKNVEILTTSLMPSDETSKKFGEPTDRLQLHIYCSTKDGELTVWFPITTKLSFSVSDAIRNIALTNQKPG